MSISLFALLAGTIGAGLTYLTLFFFQKFARSVFFRAWKEGRHAAIPAGRRRFLILICVLAGTLSLMGAGLIFIPRGSAFILPLLTAAAFGFPFLGSVWSRRQSALLEEEALVFLQLLLGYARMGTGLADALFSISESSATLFSRALGRFLNHYSAGDSLSDCLSEFRSTAGIRRTAFCLGLIEMAYKKGLPIVPVLERILPALTFEQDLREKVSQLRKTLFLQIVITAVIPGIVWAALQISDPEILQRFWQSEWSVLIVMTAILLEGAGAIFLWRLVRC